MRLAQKLNLKDGMKVRVIGKPAGINLDDVVVTSSAKADAILVFVKTLADVDNMCGPVVEAAKADRLAWIGYPKARQLGTDLNRDIPLAASAQAANPRSPPGPHRRCLERDSLPAGEVSAEDIHAKDSAGVESDRRFEGALRPGKRTPHVWGDRRLAMRDEDNTHIEVLS